MKVKELIKKLQNSKQEVEVYCFDPNGDIYPIELVDDTISDRVDLNIGKVM